MEGERKGGREGERKGGSKIRRRKRRRRGRGDCYVVLHDMYFAGCGCVSDTP